MSPPRSPLLRSLGTVFVLASLLVIPVRGQSPDTTDQALHEALATVDQLREDGDFQVAQDRLVALRDEYPGRVDVLWRLVFTWADLGKAADDFDQRTEYYEKALTAAKTALAADSTSARAHFAMAVAQGRAALNAGTRERIQRSRAVKRHADRTIALDSTLAGAYHVRGRWHREVERLGFFQRIILKTVYGGLPESSYEQAVQDFRRAIALENEVFHHLELGKTYVEMDRPDAAREELQKALDMPSSDPFAPVYKKEARQLLEEMG